MGGWSDMIVSSRVLVVRCHSRRVCRGGAAEELCEMILEKTTDRHIMAYVCIILSMLCAVLSMTHDTMNQCDADVIVLYLTTM